MRERAASLGVGLFLSAGCLLGQAAGGRRVPVTDPDELTALGMPRDAKSVSRWEAAEAGPGPSEEARSKAAETWGPCFSVLERPRGDSEQSEGSK